MSNYPENQNLHTFIFDKNDIGERTLIPVFNIDLDFCENKEYFRKDTLNLGYKDESERCAKEIYKKYSHIGSPEIRLTKMMEDIPEYSNGMQTFILGNSNYSGDYAYDILDVGDKLILVIAYIG